MRRRPLLISLAVCIVLQAQPAAKTQPKLVVAIVVDQFRYDYLTRFGPEFSGGLKRMLEQGAVFTNANYESASTVTAVGHATFLTGATPSLNGIIGNTWFERTEGKNVQSITDDSVTLLGRTGAGASPRRLLTSTIGDELKLSGKGGKVIGVSLKDRSAILPAGMMADGAYWFDGPSGSFISSTYYFQTMPPWVEQFNQSRPANEFSGKQWVGGTLPAQAGPQLYNAVDDSPFGDELVMQFAVKALEAEQLGTSSKTDLLAVSFSSVDYVGHAKGPDSPEIHDMIVRIDKVIGTLLDAAERQAGAGNVLAVFTADHGVAPVPEENQRKKMPGGRLNTQAERRAVEQALTERFGSGDFIATGGESYYFKPDPIPGKKLDRGEMEQLAANVLRQQPHVFRVYTRTQLLNGGAGGDRLDQRVRNGFHPGRSGDVFVIHDPYWQGGNSGTTHGSPFNYDTHVPVMFLGAAGWIRPGQYYSEAAIHDIAPTLATILGIAAPTGANGRVLSEMLR
jgi:hypothetical protein